MRSFFVVVVCVLSYCFVSSSKELENEKSDFLLITVATEETDGFKRFIRTVEKYNIPIKVLGAGIPWTGGNMKSVGGGQKVNLLRSALDSMVDDVSDSTIIMFTDAYDIMLLGGVDDIVAKFIVTDCNILFSAEIYCWPDSTLASQYPPTHHPYKYLNSGGFIGYFKDLQALISPSILGDEHDDQLFYTNLYLNKEIREKHRIRLDNQAVLFQNLFGSINDVILEEVNGEIMLKNSRTQTMPLVVHGNGLSKIHLNALSNYLAGAWSTTDGCLICPDAKDTKSDDIENVNLPIIVMGIFITQKTPFLQEFFDNIAKLDYPKNKIHLFIYNGVEYHRGLVDEFVSNFGSYYTTTKQVKPGDEMSERQGRNYAVERCLSKKCGYLFAVDSVAHLDSPNIIRHLIKSNKGVIGPMLVRPFKAWSNFWGSLNDNGFYARSFDYMDIVNSDRRGIWNIPYLTHTYLVNGTLLPLLTSAYTMSSVDPDMAFCTNLRNNNIFIYVDNQADHGHLVNADNFSTHVKHPEFYELFTNRWDWERRYIHQEYQKNFNQTPSEPCPDVYWFPVVTPRFCSELIDIMENFGKWSSGTNVDERLTGGYENVPTRDIHMNQVGLEPQWLEFLRLYIRPLQEHVFTGYYHDPPKSMMNFVVRYKPDEQPNLRPHHDSSTYTINIALNRPNIDYQGGGCRFIRYNCSVVDTRMGWVLMHPGRLTHYHEGLTVTSGTRYIMISFVDP